MTELRAKAILRWLVALLVATAGCAAPLTLVPQSNAGANAQRVVILKSSASPLFDKPAAALVQGISGFATTYVETLGDSRWRLLTAIERLKPDLLITLGEDAARAGRKSLSDVPMLFAMVMDHQRLPWLLGDQVMGIAQEPSTVGAFTLFKAVLPKMKKVVAFSVPQYSKELAAKAAADLKGLDIALEVVAVSGPEEIEAAYDANRDDLDAVWYLNDRALMNEQTFSFLRQRTVADKVPFLASLSDRFARAGALMSVSTQLATLGEQAAQMASAFLQAGTSAKDLGVQPPVGARLVVNMEVVRSIDLDIPEDAMLFVGEFYTP